MRKRVKLVVAYDGTNYCGWQLQPNGITIEEVLNGALSQLLGEPVTVIGASRTDSGVHSLGNVAVFDTENRMPADKICLALNQRLPEDIRVQSSEEVPLSWHPRKQNCVKTYEYKILNRRISLPTLRLYTYFSYYDLNVERMLEAAAYLVGEHDFRSFCTVRRKDEDTVRTIYSLTVDRTPDDVITIRVSGSGFLYNMVRIIAGTLIQVGTGANAADIGGQGSEAGRAHGPGQRADAGEHGVREGAAPGDLRHQRGVGVCAGSAGGASRRHGQADGQPLPVGVSGAAPGAGDPPGGEKRSRNCPGAGSGGPPGGGAEVRILRSQRGGDRRQRSLAAHGGENPENPGKSLIFCWFFQEKRLDRAGPI